MISIKDIMQANNAKIKDFGKFRTNNSYWSKPRVFPYAILLKNKDTSFFIYFRENILGNDLSKIITERKVYENRFGMLVFKQED
jgi:hypothetical protein